MTNNNNPWAGLASYEDPSKSERKLKFCGRDNDIYDVTRLIDDNLLLILYGKSGIGKTSLLNAGVFPKLRLEQYLPVSIRLGILETDASYQEAIITVIEKAIEEVRGCKTTYSVVEEQTDNYQSDRLWNYFTRNRFLNAEGQPLFPVVVLDQFEEVLRNISPEHVDKAQTLLNQLQYLIDESHALSDCIVDGKEYFYDFNFRFVISIREDELYLLEDNIDDLSLSMFRNCRYRLRSLSEQGAKEAILVPGKDCIAEEEKQAIVSRVIELSKRPQSNDIDTLLLSLVCAGTFDKKAGNKITLSDLAVWKSNPMEVYYKDAIKGLSANQVRYIQRHLIREDGSRRRLDAKEVKAALGESTYQSLTRGENRMLVLGEQGQVELLHDQLALAVYEERKAFEEKERKKRLRRRVLVTGWLILIVLGAFWLQNKNIKEQNQLIFEINQDIIQKNGKLINDSIIMAAQIDSINKKDVLIVLQQNSLELTNLNLENANTQLTIERNNLKSTNWKMMENQSRFVAEKAKTIIDEDPVLARLLAVEVLPNNLSNPQRPYTSDAEFVLRSSSLFRNTFLKGHTMNINDMQFSQDGSLIASGADDNKIIVWNTNTGGIMATLDANQGPVNHVSFSTDNKKIVSIVGFGKIIAWDIFSKKTITSFCVDAKNATFDDEGENIIAISKDSVFVWNLASEKYISQIPLELPIDKDNHYILSNSLSISFLNKNEIRYSNSYDGYSYVFDITTGKIKEKTRVYRTYGYGRHNNLDTVTNESKKAFVANNNTIMLLDTEPEDTYTYQFHNQSVNSVSYSSDGKYIVSTSEDSTICIIDATNYTLIRRMKARNSKPSVAFFNTKGDRVVSATQDKYICIWELSDNSYSVTQLPMHNNRVSDIHISPDSKWILSTSQDSTIVITNATSHDFYYGLKAQNQVSCGTFSPDGIHFAFCASGQVFVCDIESGEEKNSFPAHSSKATGIRTYSGITSICYSPDGKHLVTSSYDNSAAVWDENTGKCIVELKGHLNHVYSANYDYTGEYIVTASKDKTIKIWIAKTGVEVLSIKTNSAVNHASFRPDGKAIISAHDDGTIRIWPFPSLQDLIDQTRERFKNRPLTQEERKMYYLE